MHPKWNKMTLTSWSCFLGCFTNIFCYTWGYRSCLEQQPWPADHTGSSAHPRASHQTTPTPHHLFSESTEAVVLKKLSWTGLAKLSWLRYSWIMFGLASAGYESTMAGVPIRLTHSWFHRELHIKYLGLASLAELSGVSWLNFLTKTPASEEIFMKCRSCSSYF
jgi:hypothetical protein